MKAKLLCFLVICPLFIFAQLFPKSVNTSNGDIGFYEFLPSGYHADSTYEYPLLIFLHGVGERGNGTTELPNALLSSFPKILVKGATMKFMVHGKQHAFLVLLPQMTKEYFTWPDFYIDAMINYGKKHLKIDTNKIFLSGWSVGGGAAWKYPTRTLENARSLAGIIPVCPAPEFMNLCNLARAGVGVWAHHAENDGAVPVHFTEDAIDGILACAPAMAPLVTYYPLGGHSFVADWAYDTLNRFAYPNIYQWMIGTSRVNTAANNRPPVAIAGSDTTVYVPSFNTVLDGATSHDPNDVITSYNWTIIAGPSISKVVISKPGFVVTDVSGLEIGSYIFRLTVKDEFGISGTDDVKVKVSLPPAGQNALPLVEAGADFKTSYQTHFLKGKIIDFDGSIKSCRWRQISGPAVAMVFSYSNSAYLLGLTKTGSYGFELTATDNNKIPGVVKDTLFITKTDSRPGYMPYWTGKPPYKNNNLLNLIVLSVAALLVVVTLLVRNFLIVKPLLLHFHL